MMLQWREELTKFEEEQVIIIADLSTKYSLGYTPNERGREFIREWIQKYGFQAVLDAIDVAAKKYLKEGFTKEDVELYFKYIGGVCKTRSLPDHIQKLLYIRGIARNRVDYFDDKKAIILLKEAYQAGVSIDELTEIAKTVRNWSQFRDRLEDYIYE